MNAIPTLQQIYSGIITNLETEYGVSISIVGKVAIRVFAAVQAGKIKLLYLVLGNVQKNIFVDTADPESQGGTLERFGRVKLGRNPFAAVAGQYTLQVTGTIGGIIKAGTVFKSDDSSLHPGMLYILDGAYTLVATTDSITVRALTAGVASKLNPADTLTATAPIALVNSAAQVLTETIQPLDAENIEAYRLAAMNSYKLEAQGGSDTDYRLWSADAQGVLRVYPYAASGVDNELNLFVEATLADSVDGKGTPTAQTLLDVEAVVEMDPDTTLDQDDRGRRPLGIFQVNYLPVTVKEVDIIIDGAVGFTPTIKAALLVALTDAINAIRPFVAGADSLLDKNDHIDSNKLIGIVIQSNPGAIFGPITFTINGSLLSTYTFTDGNIPYLNSVTYT